MMTAEQIAAHCARIDDAVAREAAAYRAVQAARKARMTTEDEWAVQTAAEEAAFGEDDGWDDGIHYPGYRSEEVNGERVRVYSPPDSRGYW